MSSVCQWLLPLWSYDVIVPVLDVTKFKFIFRCHWSFKFHKFSHVWNLLNSTDDIALQCRYCTHCYCLSLAITWEHRGLQFLAADLKSLSAVQRLSKHNQLTVMMRSLPYACLHACSDQCCLEAGWQTAFHWRSLREEFPSPDCSQTVNVRPVHKEIYRVPKIITWIWGTGTGWQDGERALKEMGF